MASRLRDERDRRRCPKGATLQYRFDFWTTPEPNSGCLLWLGASDPCGYGQLKIGDIVEKSHRVAWKMAKGHIPEDKHVLHKCDNPLCCNVDHLFLGTHAENMADMASKKRAKAWPGEKNRHHKLTIEQVRSIRTDPRVHQVIADDYNISQPQVSNIKRGDSWGAF